MKNKINCYSCNDEERLEERCKIKINEKKIKRKQRKDNGQGLHYIPGVNVHF
jgi:hypothetical protein